MIFPNKFPFILLVMTTGLCCMRLLVSVHASPLGATLQDRAQLNDRGLPYYDPRVFLGYYYAWKGMLASEGEIREHDGFNALLNNGITMRIQPSCFQGNADGNEREGYVPFQITVDENQFSKLDYLYSAKYRASEGQRRSFIRSKGLDPDKTIIVSPYSIRNSKFLDDLVLVFPNSLLLPLSKSLYKEDSNLLKIDAKEDQANSEEFADWRKWTKEIIDLPPDLEPRP